MMETTTFVCLCHLKFSSIVDLVRMNQFLGELCLIYGKVERCPLFVRYKDPPTFIPSILTDLNRLDSKDFGR